MQSHVGGVPGGGVEPVQGPVKLTSSEELENNVAGILGDSSKNIGQKMLDLESLIGRASPSDLQSVMQQLGAEVLGGMVVPSVNLSASDAASLFKSIVVGLERNSGMATAGLTQAIADLESGFKGPISQYEQKAAALGPDGPAWIAQEAQVLAGLPKSVGQELLNITASNPDTFLTQLARGLQS
jgi:hypothetical protein